MKQFFVHRHLPAGRMPNRTPRGFTASVTPSAKRGHVFVGVAFCSPKDQYCRSEGRAVALASEQKEISKKMLPALLAAVAGKCDFANWLTEEEWTYVYKYMMD